jgi:hypothetical protein
MNWVNPVSDDVRTAMSKAAAFDVTVPPVARVYDFLIGGKDSYQADRDAAARLISELPHCAEAARENRAFLGRAVRHLAARGIRQFLDIGSGLPAADNVHQVAKRADPACRVVYVDNDVVVPAHARANLADDGVMVTEGDVREPEGIIAAAKELLDFSRPVAALLFAVLHFLPGTDDPHEIVRTLAAPLAPGSAVAVSHITGDDTPPAASLAAQQVYAAASAPAVPRGLGEVERFFTRLRLVPPGVVDIRTWQRRNPDLTAPLAFYGGVGIVPGREG